jgi:uncharacterized Fe-S cluster-containing radical SAM superfamily protein
MDYETLIYNSFQNFVEFSGARKDSPALLLLEGHGSHMKSLVFIASEKGVKLYCFQPQCTHRLQHFAGAFFHIAVKWYDEEEIRRITQEKLSLFFRLVVCVERLILIQLTCSRQQSMFFD